MSESSTSDSELLSQLQENLRELTTRKLSLYDPYQRQIEFHNLGAEKRERSFLAANQSGKTTSGAAEASYHSTGLYPKWWKGRRFEHPTIGWATGNSNETTRDNPQRMLFGELGEWGTGMIPKRCIKDIKRARGVADYIDTAKIMHASGELSTIRFKAYEQGRDKWQGATLDWIWFDEEPPIDIYGEGLTRTNHGGRGKGGIAWLTATPLLGMTEVIRQFYPEPETASRALIMMTIDDVGHYTDQQKEEIVAAYPVHEREARSKGIPTLGSGRVFPIQEAMLEETTFEIPKHWHQIVGCDFGWDHPTAFVRCAIDRDSKIFYVFDAYKQAEQITAVHAAAVRPWGDWIPVAWPHDGYVHDKSSGDELAASFRAEGIKMLPQHATHPSGGFGTEAAVQEMYQAMLTGKFKVMSHLSQWWDEFRTYHRKEGQIVKKFDDLMSATMKAWMMQRFARTHLKVRVPDTLPQYDPFAAHQGMTH